MLSTAPPERCEGTTVQALRCTSVMDKLRLSEETGTSNQHTHN